MIEIIFLELLACHNHWTNFWWPSLICSYSTTYNEYVWREI